MQTELLDDGYHCGPGGSAQNRLCWGISSWLREDGDRVQARREEEVVLVVLVVLVVVRRDDVGGNWGEMSW